MSAYKDKTQGTWYVSFRYIDWTGKKTQKLKRGFKTKCHSANYLEAFSSVYSEASSGSDSMMGILNCCCPAK